jgi:hypothetical protein
MVLFGLGSSAINGDISALEEIVRVYTAVYSKQLQLQRVIEKILRPLISDKSGAWHACRSEVIVGKNLF